MHNCHGNANQRFNFKAAPISRRREKDRKRQLPTDRDTDFAVDVDIVGNLWNRQKLKQRSVHCMGMATCRSGPHAAEGSYVR